MAHSRLGLNILACGKGGRGKGRKGEGEAAEQRLDAAVEARGGAIASVQASPGLS